MIQEQDTIFLYIEIFDLSVVTNWRAESEQIEVVSMTHVHLFDDLFTNESVNQKNLHQC